MQFAKECLPVYLAKDRKTQLLFPFGGKLDERNRRLRIEKLIPWEGPALKQIEKLINMIFSPRIQDHQKKIKDLVKNFLRYVFLNNFIINNQTNKIIDTIDMARFNEIYNKYKDSSPYPGYSKYLELKSCIKITLFNIYRLRLQKSKRLNILDLGTGAGYFPYLCQNYGHNVWTIDLDSVPMYNEMIDLLNIKRRIKEIKAYEKLPNFDQKFDLVTAFAICFNNHKRQDLWTYKEWSFFLTDLANNHLVNEGKLFLQLNPENDGEYYDNELLHFFESTGASVKKRRVFYNSLKYFRSDEKVILAAPRRGQGRVLPRSWAAAGLLLRAPKARLASSIRR